MRDTAAVFSPPASTYGFFDYICIQAIQNESAEGEQETAAEEGAAEEVSTEEVSAAEASTETASTDAASAEEASAETAPAETEAAAETSESVDNAETLAMDEGNASLASETGSIEDNYFTAQDGLLKIDTNGHVGYYLFNEIGRASCRERV